MGLFGGGDLFSSKWITAIIFDSGNNWFPVALKFTIGDYFPVVINQMLYVFKIEGSRILTRMAKGSKPVRIIIYSTTHFLPVSSQQKELELCLQENNLPRVEGNLYSIMKILGKKEKDPFEPHNIVAILEEIKEKEDQYSVETRNLITFLDHLKVNKIVTPIRRLSDFLEGELLETDPKFYGTVTALQERADKGNKIITNAPIGPTTNYLKIALICLIIGIAGLLIYVAYSNGWFDPVLNAGDAIKNFEGINFGGVPTQSDAEFTAKYPTPEAAKAALDRGELTEAQIPLSMRELVKNVKTPTVTPTP